MSRTPLEWHLHPQAQALIGMIAAAGYQAQKRAVRNPASSNRAPEFIDQLYFDCPEYAELAGMQQQAIEVAFRAAQAGDAGQWNTLRLQCLATLIETEIARRGQAVAA